MSTISVCMYVCIYIYIYSYWTYARPRRLRVVGWVLGGDMVIKFIGPPQVTWGHRPSGGDSEKVQDWW